MYDAGGNVVGTVSPLGVLTTFAYDALNRQTSTTEAAGTSLARVTASTYDALRLLSTTNALGVVTGCDKTNGRT